MTRDDSSERGAAKEDDGLEVLHLALRELRREIRSHSERETPSPVRENEIAPEFAPLDVQSRTSSHRLARRTSRAHHARHSVRKCAAPYVHRTSISHSSPLWLGWARSSSSHPSSRTRSEWSACRRKPV